MSRLRYTPRRKMRAVTRAAANAAREPPASGQALSSPTNPTQIGSLSEKDGADQHHEPHGAHQALTNDELPAQGASNVGSSGRTYKFDEQRLPTPPGVDYDVWHDCYNAADSRLYHKYERDVAKQKENRDSGLTRVYALEMIYNSPHWVKKNENARKAKEG